MDKFQMILLSILFMANQSTQGVPLNNGFKVKLKPQVMTDEQKVSETLFAKIPQDIKHETFQKELFSNAHLAHSSELGKGCTNQIAKILIPSPSLAEIPGSRREHDNYINIPLIDPPLRDYKIIVATAPPNIRLSGNELKPVVVFIVFSDEDNSTSINIPKIFFVHKPDLGDVHKSSKAEPILIVNNNRTVTGLKSRKIAKFIKFRNKLTNRYNYDVL